MKIKSINQILPTVCFVCNQGSLPVVCAHYIKNVLGVRLCIPVSILIMQAQGPDYFSAVPQETSFQIHNSHSSSQSKVRITQFVHKQSFNNLRKIIIIIIRHELGLDRPVAAQFNSLFIGFPSHLGSFGLLFNTFD